jgi:hypothetical protein
MLARSRSQTRATSRQWRIPKPLPASYCLDRPHIVVDLEEQHELASPGRTACDGEASMTALGQVRTSSRALRMSARGQKRTSTLRRATSGLGQERASQAALGWSASGQADAAVCLAKCDERFHQTLVQLRRAEKVTPSARHVEDAATIAVAGLVCAYQGRFAAANHLRQQRRLLAEVLVPKTGTAMRRATSCGSCCSLSHADA